MCFPHNPLADLNQNHGQHNCIPKWVLALTLASAGQQMGFFSSLQSPVRYIFNLMHQYKERNKIKKSIQGKKIKFSHPILCFDLVIRQEWLKSTKLFFQIKPLHNSPLNRKKKRKLVQIIRYIPFWRDFYIMGAPGQMFSNCLTKQNIVPL